jgi:hypothetical protein
MRLRQQGLGRLEVGLVPLQFPGGERGLEFGHRIFDVEVRVPDIKDRLGGEGPHRGAVALHGSQGHLPALLAGEPVVASRHDEARGQPLDIPFERAGQGLVEIVDVEHQATLRRGVRTEVRKVRIAAQLGPQTRRRRGVQVSGHRQRRTPVERERRHQHPAMPDRHQLRNAGFGLPEQQRHRIA